MRIHIKLHIMLIIMCQNSYVEKNVGCFLFLKKKVEIIRVVVAPA